MRSRMLSIMKTLLVAGLAASVMGHAVAQTAAGKPTRLVVPFAAGGPADALARYLGPKMAADLGNVIIDNKGGAGGTMGAADVVKSPADGSSLLFSSTGALVIFPVLSPSMPYNPDKDLTAVGHAVTTPMVILTSVNSPHKTLGDLVKFAKANPGKLNFASAGNGTTTQLCIELLKREAGIFMTHIPYRGAAPALTDVMGGTADLACVDVPAALANITGGKLRALAVTWPTRSPALPDVPTTAELGLKNVVSSTWYGLMAPAATPADVVNRINASLNKALAQPDTQVYMKERGIEIAGGSPADFSRFIQAESVKWGTLAKAVGAKLD